MDTKGEELGKKLALLLGLPPVIEIGPLGAIMDDPGREADVVPLSRNIH